MVYLLTRSPYLSTSRLGTPEVFHTPRTAYTGGSQGGFPQNSSFLISFLFHHPIPNLHLHRCERRGEASQALSRSRGRAFPQTPQGESASQGVRPLASPRGSGDRAPASLPLPALQDKGNRCARLGYGINHQGRHPSHPPCL